MLRFLMLPKLSPFLASRMRKGFTIIEVLVATGLLSISAGALALGLLNIDREMNQVEKVTTLNILRMAILSHLENDGAWKATVDDSTNSDMLCIKNQTPCAAQIQRPFKLNDAAGNLVYDSMNSTSGFATTGNLCSTYNDANGSDDCPYHAELSWQPDCVAPCIPSGLIKISANIKYNPQSPQLKKSLSSQDYSIGIVRKAVVP